MPTTCLDDFDAAVAAAVTQLDNDLAACESGSTPEIRQACRQSKVETFSASVTAACIAFANCKKSSGPNSMDPSLES